MSYKTPIKILLSDNSENFKIANFEFRKMTNKEKGSFLGSEHIELNENHTLKSMAIEPLTPYTRGVRTVFSEMDTLKYMACQFIFECEDDSIKDDINNLLMSLRLFQEGEVIAPVSFNVDKHSTHFHYPFFLKEDNIYTLNPNDIPKIENLYEKIKGNKNEKLTMVLDRFSSAIDYKTKINNSFVDLVGILENLVVPDTTELTFKFSLYVSHILNNYCNYPISFKSVDNFYKIRSKFAHEGKYDKIPHQELQGKHRELKNIVRKLIVFFIQNNCEFDAKKILLNDLKIEI